MQQSVAVLVARDVCYGVGRRRAACSDDVRQYTREYLSDELSFDVMPDLAGWTYSCGHYMLMLGVTERVFSQGEITLQFLH